MPLSTPLLTNARALAAGFALATLAEAALHVGPALAEPYIPRGSYPGYVAAPVPVAPIWTGVYVGGHLGGGWGSSSSSATPDDTLSGLVGGIHGGYNHQRGSFLIGVEADATPSGAEKSWQIFDGTQHLKATASVPWVASIRGRVGLVNENWLFFVTGGVGFGEVKGEVSASGLKVSVSGTDTGYVVGGGVERQFGNRFSARAEVLHYGFTDLAIATTKADLDFTVVRAGLTFHVQ